MASAFTDVQCPKCDAPVGSGCTTRHGQPLKHQHDVRVEASLAPWRVQCSNCGAQRGLHGTAPPHSRGEECAGFKEAP